MAQARRVVHAARRAVTDVMPHQVALTIHATVAGVRGATAARAVLDRMHAEGAARTTASCRSPSSPACTSRASSGSSPRPTSPATAIPAALFYMADVDAPVHRHLRALVTEHGAGCDALFGSCDGYPAEPTPGLRMAWLLPRMVEPAATYVHRVGRSVGQVHDEHRLRNSLETWLDLPADMPRGLTAVQAHDRVRSFVLRRDDLRWSARRGTRTRSRLPAARPRCTCSACRSSSSSACPCWCRRQSCCSCSSGCASAGTSPSTSPATDEKIAALETTEDHVAQNPFTAIGFVEARPAAGSDDARRTARAGLVHPARLPLRQPRGSTHDPLRPMGADRRRATADLRELVRRFAGELHGRFHRPARVGPQRRVQQRRRLPIHAGGWCSTARRTRSLSRTTCATTRS